MRTWGLALTLSGCGAFADGSIVDDAPEELSCSAGVLHTLSPDQVSDDRMVAGTEVRRCVNEDGTPHGDHVEVHPGGTVAAIGQWASGARNGTWARWSADGAYEGRTDYNAGVREGLEHLVSSDGLILEIRYEGDVAVGLRALPRDTPMPEWVDGNATEGTRHLEQGASGADP